jgi:hypothetical protein
MSETTLICSLEAVKDFTKDCCFSHLVLSFKKIIRGCWAEGKVGFWEPRGRY